MFKWDALYKDKSILSQYEKDGTEHLFKEIQQDKLVNFGISNGKHYIVENVQRGVFIIDNVPITIKGFSNKAVDYRIIYFRRVQQTLGGDATDGSNTISHIGLQYTENKVNHKVIINIADSGELNYTIDIK